MGFKNPGVITVRQSTKDNLSRFKAESETWDELLARAADSALGGGERQ